MLSGRGGMRSWSSLVTRHLLFFFFACHGKFGHVVSKTLYWKKYSLQELFTITSLRTSSSTSILGNTTSVTNIRRFKSL